MLLRTFLKIKDVLTFFKFVFLIQIQIPSKRYKSPLTQKKTIITSPTLNLHTLLKITERLDFLSSNIFLIIFVFVK
jgi:hypothetical protein